MKRLCGLSLTAILLIVVLLAGGCGGKSGKGKGNGADVNYSAEKAMTVSEITAKLEDAKAGDTFTMGSWEQDGKTNNGAEPIAWTVLCQDVGKALVLTNYCIERLEFLKSDDRYTSCIWPESDLRKWMEETFYSTAFTDEEKAMILLTENTISYTKNYEPQTATSSEHVFALSVDEAWRYLHKRGGALPYGVPTPAVAKNDFYMSEVKNVEGVTKAMSWWLRDVGSGGGNAADMPGYDSKPDTVGGDVIYKSGVRPAMWIVYDPERMNGYAAGTASPKEDAALNALLAGAKVGDKLTLGMWDFDSYAYNGYEDLEWTVLEDQGDALLLLATAPFTSRCMYKDEDVAEEDAVWAKSDLRAFLNDPATLDQLFTPQEKAKILLTTVSTSDNNGTWKRDGGPDSEDLLFVPDASDVDKYPDQFSTGYCWLRSPDFTTPYMACISEGRMSNKEGNGYTGVRPMMRVKKG